MRSTTWIGRSRRGPTYTPFLLHCALRRAPWRLLFLPLVILSMLAYVTRLIDRAKLKEINHALLLGPKIHPKDLGPLVESFADRQVATNIRPARARPSPATKRKGAAWCSRPPPTAFTPTRSRERLGFDDVIGTGSIIGLDERVHAKIAGENCYGPAKLRMIADWVEKRG